MKTNTRKPKTTRARDHADESRRGERQALVIPLHAIDSNPLNPRLDFDEDALRGLANSLTAVDLLHPVHVHQGDARGRYRLISGERRVRAARAAGWQTIPAVVCDVGPETAARMVAAENLQREKLNPIEKARTLQLLTLPAREGGGEMTVTEIAHMLGMSQPWVSNTLRLLKLPDHWQARIISGELSPRAARAIASVVNRPEVLTIVEQDCQANPQDWRTAEDFERKIPEITARLDALAAGDVGGTGPDPDAPLEPLRRRAMSIDHGPQGGDDTGDDSTLSVEDIVAGIAGLSTLDELDAVQAAIEQRRKALTATAAAGRRRRPTGK